MQKQYCTLKGSNKIFEIIEIKNNKVKICNDNLVVTTAISNISVIDGPVPVKHNRSYTLITNQDEIMTEIMLRHMTKDEAISVLDKYLDKAILNKLGRVRIIHGRHGGVLRQAVHEYLSTHPYVKQFHIADYHEGGIGVTIAFLGKK